MTSDVAATNPVATSTRRLLSSAISTSGLTGGYTVMLLITTVLLARWLGAEQYGVYALVNAVAVIVGHLATPGTENLLVRDVAAYGAHGLHGRSRGLLTRSNQVAIFTSAFLIVSVLLVTWATHSFKIDSAFRAMAVGCLLIPVSALSRVRAATLVGLHHVLLARLPELVIRPVSLLVFVLAAILLDAPASASVALAATCIAYLVSYIVGTITLRRVMPAAMREQLREYDYARWVRSSLPFLALGFTDVLTSQLTITLIGWLGTAADAGVFAVANRGSAVVALGFAGVSAVAAPRISHLWATADFSALDQLLKHCAMLAGGLAAVATVIATLFRNQLLTIFGPTFVSGAGALVILSVGQLVWSATAITATALLMTGGERQAAATMLLSLALTTVLSIALVPSMGQNGVALAWTASICVGQGVTIYFWRRHRVSTPSTS